MGTEQIKRCVIVTGGPMNGYERLRGFLNGSSDFVVCADGGVRHLKPLGLKPDVVIGDFDSAGELPENVKAVKFNSEKDETDTVLALHHGLSKGYRNFLILGGLSGRLDHTYANLCTLRYMYHGGGRGFFADGSNEAYYIENGSITLKNRKGWYVSVFPFGLEASGVTETGLKYSLEDAVMHTGFPNGVSNEFVPGQDGRITVKKGSLLIILSEFDNH